MDTSLNEVGSPTSHKEVFISIEAARELKESKAGDEIKIVLINLTKFCL